MPDNLYKRQGVWYARVEIGGRDIRRSLRTASKTEAVKRRPAILEEAQHRRFFGGARVTWVAAVPEWEKNGTQALRPATVRRYLDSLRQCDPILGPLYLDQISRETIARIARRPGISNATRRRDITAVSVVLRWCVGQAWCSDNPAAAWDRSIIKERRDPIMLPGDYDIDCVVDAAPHGFAAMIRFAQYTGMRQEEIASLEHGQVDLARGALMLTRTKTSRPRSVPLDERAAGTLSGTLRMLGSPFVFWHGRGRRYNNPATRFAKIMRRACALAKVDGRPIPRRFRFHDLRHWFAVDYLRRGGSIYQLQKILGHSSIQTTEIYLDHLTPAEADAVKIGKM